MERLFSETATEFYKMYLADPVGTTKMMKWFTGNAGIARSLRDGKLITVPADMNLTYAQVRDAIYGEILSMFCACLGDAEAVENYKEAKRWVAMRQMATDIGVAPTSPIVRLIDPARHLPFNMKVAARNCGPCVEDFRHMQDWGYDGSVAEYNGRKKLLVFGVPSIVLDNTKLTMDEQEDLLKDMSKNISVPKLIHGSAALGALVSLSHFHETGGELNGQCLPVGNIFARTSTNSDGYRLYLRWSGDGRLDCGYLRWRDDGDRCFDVGCFALGVVEL